jgi:hypothetical protein
MSSQCITRATYRRETEQPDRWARRPSWPLCAVRDALPMRPCCPTTRRTHQSCSDCGAIVTRPTHLSLLGVNALSRFCAAFSANRASCLRESDFVPVKKSNRKYDIRHAVLLWHFGHPTQLAQSNRKHHLEIKQTHTHRCGPSESSATSSASSLGVRAASSSSSSSSSPATLFASAYDTSSHRVPTESYTHTLSKSPSTSTVAARTRHCANAQSQSTSNRITECNNRKDRI